MALEAGTFLNDLVVTNPVGATDPVSEGDNHLRLLKTVLRNTFPGLAGIAFRVANQAANYTVIGTDNMTLIRATTTLTLTFTAAATLGNGFLFFVYNDSAGVVTLDPAGTETINGNLTEFLYSDEFAGVFCNGTAFFKFGINNADIPNPIYNSGMEIWNNGPGTATVSAANTNLYGPEGFQLNVAGTSATVALYRDTNVPAVTVAGAYVNARMKLVNEMAKAVVAAGDFLSINHPIEGYTWQGFAQRPLELSFLARSSITGTYSIALRNAGLNRSYVKSYTITAPNTWELKRFRIPASPAAGTWNYTASIGVSVLFTLMAGSSVIGSTDDEWTAGNFISAPGLGNWTSTLSASFGLTAVSIQPPGSNRTWFARPMAQEIALTQRYFWKTFDTDIAPAQNAGTTGVIAYTVTQAGANTHATQVPFPTSMRIAPTTTFYNPSALNALWRNASLLADSGAGSTFFVGERGITLVNAQVAGDGVGNTCVVHTTFNSRM